LETQDDYVTKELLKKKKKIAEKITYKLGRLQQASKA
jgi:hypothetical protein